MFEVYLSETQARKRQHTLQRPSELTRRAVALTTEQTAVILEREYKLSDVPDSVPGPNPKVMLPPVTSFSS